MIAVTRHGEERVRERLALPKRAVRGVARRAWLRGARRAQYRGAFRHYLDSVAGDSTIRVYGRAVYVFDVSWNAPALVTVWPIPAHLRAAAARPIHLSVAGAASGAGVDPDARHPDTDPPSREIGPSAGSLPLNPTTAPSSLAARERLPERMDRDHERRT